MALDSYFSLHNRSHQVYSQIPKVPRVILTLPVNDTKHACFHTQALPTPVIFPALTLTEAVTFNSTFFFSIWNWLFIARFILRPSLVRLNPSSHMTLNTVWGVCSAGRWSTLPRKKESYLVFNFYFKDKKYQVIWLVRSAMLFCPFI